MFWRKKKSAIESRYQWFDKDDPRNKFGVRIIDCRPVTQTLTATTDSMEIADSYVRLRTSKGSEYSENEMSNYVKLEVALKYPLEKYEHGVLYKSPEMDYKWDIYLHNDTLIFTRSWTGQLVYVTPLNLVDGVLSINEIHTTPEFENMGSLQVKKEVDFLIKSHLFEITVPHPIKPSLEKDSDEIIALSAFANWGRLGSFGSFEDTSKISVDHLSEIFNYLLKSEFNTIEI